MYSSIRKKLRKVYDRVHFINHLKNVWSKKNVKKKWAVGFKLVSFIGSLLPIPFESSKKNGPFAYFYLFTSCSYFTMVIYTVGYYIEIGQFRECFSCFCIFVALIPVRPNQYIKLHFNFL